MTPTVTEELMTAEDFLKKYGDESGVELVKGRVVRLPMPGGKHGDVCSKATFYLTGYAMEKQSGRVMCNDTFIRTDRGLDTFRGADVLFVSYKRLPKEQPSPEGPLEFPPELVIEVRSPSDRLLQLNAKATEYLEAGVAAVVVLDPNTDSAAVFRADELPMRYSNGDELTLPDVLPGFSVPVRKFFE